MLLVGTHIRIKGTQAQAGHFAIFDMGLRRTRLKAVSKMIRTTSKSHVLGGSLLTALTTLCFFRSVCLFLGLIVWSLRNLLVIQQPIGYIGQNPNKKIQGAWISRLPYVSEAAGFPCWLVRKSDYRVANTPLGVPLGSTGRHSTGSERTRNASGSF